MGINKHAQILDLKIYNSLFPLINQPPKHLAYIEWFTPFPLTPDSRHGMYKITCFIHSGERVASIIPVSNIACSVHLI
ncbi:hypothetical protein DFH29DRAFT_953648, partial [Suillus ampliporus]